MEGRIDERLRVARDLHDTLLQSFQGLIPVFQTARNLLPGQSDRAAEVLDEGLHDAADAIVEGRNAIQNLRAKPSLDPDLGSLLNAAGKELAQSPEAEGSAPSFRVVVEGRGCRSLHSSGTRFIGSAAKCCATPSGTRTQAGSRQKSGTSATCSGYGFAMTVRGSIRASSRKARVPGISVSPACTSAPSGWAGRLKIWSEPGAGTEAELTVPARIAYEKFSASNGWWARLVRRLRLTAPNREA